MGEKEATQKEATEKKAIIDANNDKQKKVVDEGPITVVLKLDLHCDGCAKKVKKSVRYIQGVESVKADSKSNKLTIIGKVNPVHIKERVEYKTKKKVEIISPKPKKEDTDQGDKKAVAKPATEPKSNDQKPKEPQSTSVVLKIPLHCDGCIQKIKRIILKIDGVESVKPDGNKNLVTVEGTMNTKELVPYLKNKLKRDVDIVPPAKKEENKDNVEKKVETKVEAGENKKDEKKKEGNGEKKKEGDKEGETKKKNDVAKEADNIIKSVEKKKNGEEKVASGDQSEKDKSSGGGEATSIGSGDGDGSKNNVNVMNNKLEYYRHDPYTYTMPPVLYNQSYHNQDYGVQIFPSHYGYGNEGYVGMGYQYHGPPPPPSPMSIHNPRPAASENDVFSADNPNVCSIM